MYNMTQYDKERINETIEYIKGDVYRQEWANEVVAQILEMVRAKSDSKYEHCKQQTDYSMIKEIVRMFPE
mgnify:CR=1 FL=1|jgi:hypothetical protein